MNTNKKERMKQHIKLSVLAFINRSLSTAAGIALVITGYSWYIEYTMRAALAG